MSPQCIQRVIFKPVNFINKHPYRYHSKIGLLCDRFRQRLVELLSIQIVIFFLISRSVYSCKRFHSFFPPFWVYSQFASNCVKISAVPFRNVLYVIVVSPRHDIGNGMSSSSLNRIRFLTFKWLLSNHKNTSIIYLIYRIVLILIFTKWVYIYIF